MATATIQANEANDIFLADGENIIILTGIPACSQNILQSTLMRTSENIYAILEGVNYFGTVFTPKPNYDAFRQSVAEAILSCPDVINIESLTTTVTQNSLNYLALVNTTYGAITVSK